MANNAGKTVTTLLIGAAIGAVAGYLLGTEKEQRDEQFEHLKSTARKNYEQIKGKVKEKLGKKAADIEEEIYNA